MLKPIRSALRGFWNCACFRPIMVTDVDKFRQEVPTFSVPDTGLITFKRFKLLTNEELRRVDKLLFGGGEKWDVAWENLVVNAGLDHALDATLSGGTQITTWYVGLVDGASPTFAAGDTMSSHAGWTENENYSEGARQTWVDGGVSSQSVSNSASTADFSIDTNSQTLGGAFLTSDSTKGGTTGTLYAAGDFTNDKSADNGDTLSVTATFTSADDGV